jgi:hypothetical protein
MVHTVKADGDVDVMFGLLPCCTTERLGRKGYGVSHILWHPLAGTITSLSSTVYRDAHESGEGHKASAYHTFKDYYSNSVT